MQQPSAPATPTRVAVTGANRGIGLATVSALLAAGADVVATYRSEHPELPAPSGQLTWVRVDMAQRDDVDRLAALDLDGLVANAGLPYIGKVGRTSLDDARHYVEVNLTSAARLADRVARAMAARGNGSIVLVSSVSACYGILGAALYGGAKSGLVGCARSLTRQFATQGVRIHTVAPGYVETRVTADLAHHMRAALVDKHIPATRFASAEEVGAALAHLALRSHARPVPGGALLPLDGGFAMGWR